MSEQMLLEARTVARERRTNPKLRRALEMAFIPTAAPVMGGIEEGARESAPNPPTYAAQNLSRAALNQVKFNPGKN